MTETASCNPVQKHLRIKAVVDYLANTVISPSSLKDMERCEVQGALVQTSGGKGIDRAHAHYGNAFGIAAAHICIHATHIDDPEVGRAIAYAATEFGFFEKIRDKTWLSLLECIFAFNQLWFNKYYPAGWRGHSTEKRVLLECDGGVVIGGAYDLKCVNINTGMYRIFDFKAVESEFMYRWDVNMQIMHYTFLDYVIYGTEFDGCGCYFVALVSDTGVQLFERQPKLHLHRQFERYIEDAYRKGLALRNPDTLAVAPGGWACDGRSACKFLHACYGDNPVPLKLSIDDRIFNNPIARPVSLEALKHYAKEFVAMLDRRLPQLIADTEAAEVDLYSSYVDDGDDDAASLISHLLRED